MTEPARILGEPVDTDPHIFEPTEAALAAMVRRILLRARIYDPTPEQIESAKTSARVEYSARAEHAISTGKVLP